MYRRLLVPIDDTDLSIEVVGNAVGLARALGAHVTFCHAVAGDAAGGPSLDPQHLPAHPLVGKAGELLAKAAAAARAFGVPCDSKLVRSEPPAAAVVEAARDCGCDLVFMAAPAHRAAPATAPALDTLAAVMDAGLPVLVSRAADPGPLTRAIGIIRDEHRALAAVLHAWLHLLARSRSAGLPADPALMRACVRYLRVSALALHGAKEDEYLFGRLRERTRELNAELDELQRQHLRDRQHVAELALQVEALASASGEAATDATRQLDETLRLYAAFVWEHLGREEGVILPAAQRHLSEADWSAIEGAFARHREPGSDGAADAQVGRLFSLIVMAARDPA